MSVREVLFFDTVDSGGLLVRDIVRDGDDIRAEVVNGAWSLSYRNGVLYARDGRHIVDSHPAKLLRAVKIPPEIRSDYNAVIEWARERVRAPRVAVLLEDFPYHYGPTDTDPDPGKKWHIGCGGEVSFIDDGLICAKCGAQASNEE